MKPKPFVLALEVDRNLRLDLNNGQFELLANMIDGYEDSRTFANKLMASGHNVVLRLIMNAKKID